MRLKKRLLSLLFLPLLSVAGFAATANAQLALPVDAEVVTVLTVTQNTALSFGRFGTDGTASTVTFDAGGSGITAGGGITLLGGEQIGSVDVSGTLVNGDNIRVDVAGSNLTAPASQAMLLQANCIGPSGTLGSLDGFCTYTSDGTTQTVEVGGVLNVNTNQESENYSGTVTVTANIIP